MSFLEMLRAYSGSEPDDIVEAFASAVDALLEAKSSHFSASRLALLASVERPHATRLSEAAVNAGIFQRIYEIECPDCGDLVATSTQDPTGSTRTCVSPTCERTFVVANSDLRVLYGFTEEQLPRDHIVVGGAGAGGGNRAASPSQPWTEWLDEVLSPSVPLEELCTTVEACLATTDPTLRGGTLEDCVRDLFRAYPALFHDEGKRLGAGEKDRVITVVAPPTTVPHSWGVARLYVDCKHEVARYSSAYASVFLTRLREVEGKKGVAIATAGITRDRDANAQAVFREAYIRDGLVVGVIDAASLSRVCDGVQWWAIVHEALVTAEEGSSRS